MKKKIPSIPAIGIIALVAIIAGTIVVLTFLQMEEAVKIISFKNELKRTQNQEYVIGQEEMNAPNLKSYINSEGGYEFKYTDYFIENYKYIKVDWPPQVSISDFNDSFLICDEGELAAGEAKKVFINNTEYCRTVFGLGREDAYYVIWYYEVVKDKKKITFQFKLPGTGCGEMSYEDHEKCQKEFDDFYSNVNQETRSFLTDGLINQIFSTFRFIEENDFGKILITKENEQEMLLKELDVCGEKGSCGFNSGPSTEQVLFSNEEKGISLKIPYSPDWGNERYKLSPYFSYEDSLAFGPLVPHPYTAWWMREYILQYVPLRSVEEVISSLVEAENNKGEYGVSEDKVIKDKINGHVIVFVARDLYVPDIDDPTVEIIGNKYNYKLYPCYYPDLCRDIIETFEFID